MSVLLVLFIIWIKLVIIALTQTYQEISSTWYDNYINGPPQGWILMDENSFVISDTITSDKNRDHHGPYQGIDDGNMETYTLEQQFYCSTKSSVDVSFWAIFCSTQNSDYVDVYINDNFTARLNPTDGNEYTPTPNLNTFCDNGWYAKGPWMGGTNAIPSVTGGTLFKIGFVIGVDATPESIGITDIEITCNQMATPTPSTTNPTTISPTLMLTTLQPTTNIPTTFEPTTSNPTTNTPSASNPTTITPTTASPTSNQPATSIPTSVHPTTTNPSTKMPTETIPTTSNPTDYNPTNIPTSAMPTTLNPTGYNPTTGSSTNTKSIDNTTTISLIPTISVVSTMSIITEVIKSTTGKDGVVTEDLIITTSDDTSSEEKTDISSSNDPTTLYSIISVACILCICFIILILIIHKKQKNKLNNNKTKMKLSNVINRNNITSLQQIQSQSNSPSVENRFSQTDVTSLVGVNDVVNNINKISTNIQNGENAKANSNDNKIEMGSIITTNDKENDENVLNEMITPNGMNGEEYHNDVKRDEFIIVGEDEMDNQNMDPITPY